MIDGLFCKLIDVADFDDPALIPFLQFIAYDEMVRFGLSDPVILPDSKQWECAMMLRTFAETGILKPGALFAGIGAGTEQTTFALAAKGAVVFPTDRYLERTPWSDVAPVGMMVAPESFSAFSLERGLVIPVHTDARALRLPSNTFDGVYSAGSIEHFGSLDAVAAAAEEIGRVLKPGGIAAISTEFRLEGPNDRAWFDDSCILFTPGLIEQYILAPSGLIPVGELDYSTSDRTYEGRVVLVDFLDKAKKARSLADKRNAYPNLVLSHEGFLFCSVHLALRKPEGGATQGIGERSRRFEPVVETETTRALQTLASGLYGTRGSMALHPSMKEDERVAQLEVELHVLRNSRSFRLTRPMRKLAHYIRQKPILHRVVSSAAKAARSLRSQLR